MKKTEENAHLMAEKARVSEEEALVLSKRASEAEAECQRMKLSQIKVEFGVLQSSNSPLSKFKLYFVKGSKVNYNEVRNIN